MKHNNRTTQRLNNDLAECKFFQSVRRIKPLRTFCLVYTWFKIDFALILNF